MKKIIRIVILISCLCCFVACGKTDSVNKTNQNAKYSIVCTIFPQYDWVREIIGDRKDDYDLTLLLDNGVDLHSYQPTAEDIAKISECDMFLYVGGESDAWAADALKEKKNDKMCVIDMLEVLGDTVKEEEVVEGMEEEEHADHEHADHEHEEGHEDEEPEYDEHIWLSLRNAKTLSIYIEQKIQELDVAHKESYEKNRKNYVDKLDELDNRYKTTVESATSKTLLFGDRFPFRYLTDDYGLTYYAAFVGCSAETEASFDTITFLAGKVDELQLPCILTIENSDQKIAQAIQSNTKEKNQKILALDSIQSVTATQVKKGASYLESMTTNLATLKKALGLNE